jgi:hypothetical protein
MKRSILRGVAVLTSGIAASVGSLFLQLWLVREVLSPPPCRDVFTKLVYACSEPGLSTWSLAIAVLIGLGVSYGAALHLHSIFDQSGRRASLEGSHREP